MKIKLFDWKQEQEKFFYNGVNNKYNIKYHKIIKIKPTLHCIDYYLSKSNFYAYIRLNIDDLEQLIIKEINKLFIIESFADEIIKEYIEIAERTWLLGFRIENKFLTFLPEEYIIYKSLELDKKGIDFKIYDPYIKEYWYIQIKSRRKLDVWYKNYYSSNIKNYLLLKYNKKFDTFKLVN